MKITCNECNSSEFSVLETRMEEIYFDKGTGFFVKDIECDNCGAVYRLKMDVDITSFELR